MLKRVHAVVFIISNCCLLIAVWGYIRRHSSRPGAGRSRDIRTKCSTDSDACLRDHGKGRRDRHRHNTLCERPLTSRPRPRAGSRDVGCPLFSPRRRGRTRRSASTCVLVANRPWRLIRVPGRGRSVRAAVRHRPGSPGRLRVRNCPAWRPRRA